MEEKTFSVVTRYRIYCVLSWAGVIIALAGYFMGGLVKQILPWVGLIMVLFAVIFRFTMIRCPHCGNPLTQSKHIPAECPQCHKELN